MSEKIKPIIAYHTGHETSHGAGLCFVSHAGTARTEATAARKVWMATAPRFRVQAIRPDGEGVFSWHATRDLAQKVADQSRQVQPNGHLTRVRELTDRELSADLDTHRLSLSGSVITVEIAAEENVFLDWDRRPRSERVRQLLHLSGVQDLYDKNLVDPRAPASTKGNGEGKHLYACLAHFYGRESADLFNRQRNLLLGERTREVLLESERARLDVLDRLIGDPVTTGERMASEYLADAFVAGIRYESEAGRGEVPRYVVFRPETVRPTHRDGVLLTEAESRTLLDALVANARLQDGPVFALLPGEESVQKAAAGDSLSTEQAVRDYLPSPEEAVAVPNVLL